MELTNRRQLCNCVKTIFMRWLNLSFIIFHHITFVYISQLILLPVTKNGFAPYMYADKLTTSLVHNCNIFCLFGKTVGEFASKKSLRHGKCIYQMEKHRTP